MEANRPTRVFHRRAVFETRDFDEARDILSRSAVPYDGDVSKRTKFSTVIHVVESADVSLSEAHTTGVGRVRAQLPGDSYAIVLSLAGAVEHWNAGKAFEVSDRYSLVHCPGETFDARPPESYGLLFVRFSCVTLTRELEKMLGQPVQAPLVFDPQMPMHIASGGRFRQLALQLRSQVLPQQSPGQGVRESGPLPDDLLRHLLEMQKHNYSRLLSRYAEAGARQVRQAEEYMRSNACWSPQLGDICDAVGLSSRTLQYSFQKRYSCSPMEFLRQLRMEGVRQDLLAPEPDDTVTSLAAKWGFVHFGRFSVEYGARFGERPSDTLRRRLKRAS